MLGLGADREILRIHLQRRLFFAGSHPARPRHFSGLRPVEIGNRKTFRARTASAACDGDDGLRESMFVMAGHSRLKDGVAYASLCPAIHVLAWSQQSKSWMPGSSPGMTVERPMPR